MRCLVFDPFCGATGRMVLGALLACGADGWRVKSAVESLSGKPVSVVEDASSGMVAVNAYFEDAASEEITFDEAVKRLNVMHDESPVRTDAMDIVRRIKKAIEKTYGGSGMIRLDTVAIIAGICAAIDSLGRPNIRSTPVSFGGGMVERQGRLMPVPLPEMLEALNGSKLLTQGGPFDGELLTLEAAAVLAHFVSLSDRYYPEGRALSIGYGKGDAKLPVPSVLRAAIYEVDDALIGDRIELLETNVDDVTGEVLGSLIEELLTMGARDVSIIPATMKKGRSGQLIRVVAKAEDGPALSRRIMLETGTLGVRVIPVRHRHIAIRNIEVLTVNFEGSDYDMRFKVATDMSGSVLDVSVEYEDAKKVARELGIPLKTIMRKADSVAWEHYDVKR